MIWLALLITCGLVVASVSIHYEALRLLSILQRSEKRWYSNRLRASLLVLGCLIAHGLEVIVFGLGYQIFEHVHHGADLYGAVPDGFNCNY